MRKSASDRDFPFLIGPPEERRGRARFEQRGVVVFGPPALASDAFAALQLEAREQRWTKSWPLVGTDRADRVDQSTVRAELGPRARTLLGAPSTMAMVEAITGQRVLPSWPATCLTYYDRPGQFLSEHTDKVTDCRFALLVYLDVSYSPDGRTHGTGLHLRLPRTPEFEFVVTAAPNRIVLVAGSRVPHWRPPLVPGESVTLIAGCLRCAS